MGRKSELSVEHLLKENERLKAELESLKAINGKGRGNLVVDKTTNAKGDIIASLFEREAGYLAVVDQMNEGVAITDSDHIIRYVNPNYCKLTGKKKADLVGKHLWDAHAILELDRKALDARSKRRMKGQSEIYQLSIPWPDGSKRWLNVSATPIYGADKTVIGSMGIVTDVTAQKQTESEKERFLTIIDSTIDFVGVSDNRGKTMYINQACRKALGIKASENALAYSFEQFYSPKSFKIIQTEVVPYVLKHGTWKGELSMISRKGKEIAISQVTICKKDDEGNVEFFASIARDISEIKNAQREIAILARMPDENPAPVLRISKDGSIAYANAASGLLLKEWKTQQGKKLPSIWVKVIAKILSSGRQKEYEVDCGRKVYELKLVPVPDYSYVNIIGSDITQKKKAEKLLIASEKKYRAVVEDQTELISRFLADGTVTFANAAYCRYFNIKVDEVMGKKLFNYVPPGARKKFRERLATLTRENPVVTYSQQIKKNGIPHRWQMWTDRAIYDDNGIFIEYQSVGRDVTELKEAEMELQKKELYLRQVIDTIPNLIYVKNDQGKYKMVNKAFADFINHKVTNTTGVSDKELFGAGHTRYELEDMEVLSKHMTHITPEEKITHMGTGHEHWFHTIKTPLFSLDDGQREVLGISTDITQRKRFEDALHFQLEFKELISSISTRFINLPYQDIDEAINYALQSIGTFTGMDRAVITLLEGEMHTPKYNWLAPGVKIKEGRDRNVEVLTREILSWASVEARKNGTVNISSETMLPSIAARDAFRKLRLKSLLLMPLQSKNRIFGYLSISNYKQEKHWEENSIALLKIVAQMFSSALERRTTEEMLNFRMELENIITTISANFINIPPQLINTEINASIRYIATFFGIDQGYLYTGDSNSKNFRMSHCWFENDPDPDMTKMDVIPTRDNLWVYKQLKQFGVFAVASVDDLGKEAANLKDRMIRAGVRSMISVPIIYHGDFIGILSFGSKEKESFWPEESVPLLKILGQVFANALERKQTEEDLTETKELYRTLARNIPKAAVLLFDKDLRYRLIEGAALEEQGYSKGSLEGKTIYEVLPPRRLRILEPLYRQALEGKENTFESEFNKKHYLIHVLPVTNDHGEIYAGMVMSLDISDLKETQRMLERQTDVLQRSNEDLEMFAYAASHDLQEPLRMISSYVHLIQRKLADNLTDETNEFMFFAIDGVKRMQQLINDLLEYSRVDRKGNPFREIDLNSVVEFVKLNLKARIEETGAQLVSKKLPVIMADQPQIISLLQNLVENAIKFRGEHEPHIEIGCKEFKTKWRFHVKDNGIGIENKYFERIFVIFQRLNSRREYSGTGIGLAICKKIVERHGGKIWPTSTMGKGTTFYFEIAKQTNAGSDEEV